MSKNEKRKVALFTQMVTLFIVCCTFFLNTQDVSAATLSYVDYAEPSVGDNSGYIILEFSNGKVATYFWSAYSQSEYINEVESVDTGCSIVIDDSKVTFTILTDSNIDPEVTNVTTYYTFSNYSTSGNCSVLRSGSTVDSNPSYTYETTATIVGYSYKGNVSLVTDQLDNGNSEPVVIFGDDIVGQYVHDLYLLIGQQKNGLDVYLPKLNKIEAWESRNNEQLELLVGVTGQVLDSINASFAQGGDIDSIRQYLVTYLPYLQNISAHLSAIEVDVDSMRKTIESMVDLFENMLGSLGATEDISEYMVDLYELLSQNSTLLNTYLPKLADIATLGNQSKVQLELLFALTEDIFEELKVSGWYIETYLPYLQNISAHLSALEVDIDAMRGTLVALLDLCEDLYERADTIQNYTVTYLPYLVNISAHLSALEVDVDTIDDNVASIDKRIEALAKALTETSAIDKESMDDFRNDSFGQSSMLDSLNTQSQVAKPNVNDMSNKVDENLDVVIDADYGVLLSTFTSNNRILTMLLIVASVSLVSYVLFGKR